jgi:hypothetical protein
VAAKKILAEDLPQLSLQIVAIHVELYALTVFKIYDYLQLLRYYAFGAQTCRLYTK